MQVRWRDTPVEVRAATISMLTFLLFIGVAVGLASLYRDEVRSVAVGALQVQSTEAARASDHEADGVESRVKQIESYLAKKDTEYSQDLEAVVNLQSQLKAALESEAPSEDASNVTAAAPAPAASNIATPTPKTPTATSTSSQTNSGKVRINSATAAELDSLPGIGLTYAQRIVDYRAEHGPFASVDDLLLVKGIGASMLSKIRDLVEL